MAEELDEQAMVEYLQNNHLFSKAWFVQNAPKEFIQEWFNFRRQPLSNSAKVKLSDANGVTSNGTVNSNSNFRPFLSVSNLLEDERSDDDGQMTASAYAQIARDGRNSITLELFHDIVSRGSLKKKSSTLIN